MSSDVMMANAIGHSQGLTDLLDKNVQGPLVHLDSLTQQFGTKSPAVRCPTSYCEGYCRGARLDDETTADWLEQLARRHHHG